MEEWQSRQHEGLVCESTCGFDSRLANPWMEKWQPRQSQELERFGACAFDSRSRDHYDRLMKFIVLLLLASCHTPPPAANHAPANFLFVRDGLYRGGHPDAAALDYLRTLHVHMILNLEIADGIEATSAQIAEEERLATARGFVVVPVPISAFELGVSDRFDDRIREAEATLANPAAAPVYVHCLHGQDRTGLVIGLERVQQENWTPDRAYAEMLSLGFHPMFHGLREYFERVTGTP